MMNKEKVTNLSSHRNKKKLEFIRGDIETAINILKIVKTGLGEFAMYVPIRSIMISIVNNEKLLSDHLQNIKEKLKNE